MVHQGNNSSTIYAENDALERIPNYPKGHAKGLKKKKKKKENLIFWIHADEVTLPDSYERGGWLDE